MITNLTLSDALARIYGRDWAPSAAPISEWQLFTPFCNRNTQATLLAKLIEVPAHLYTSEEVYARAKAKYRGLLHDIKLVFVERCFQSSYYLAIAHENLISLDSVILIKREAQETVDEGLVYDFLEFIGTFAGSPVVDEVSFDQTQIGINSQGKLVLANYYLYFEDDQKTVSQRRYSQGSQRTATSSVHLPANVSIIRDIRQVLLKLLLSQSEKTDLFEVYESVEKKYGKNMVTIVEKCMEPCFDCKQLVECAERIKNSQADQSFSATVTETCIEQSEKISCNLMNESQNTAFVDLSFQIKKKNFIKNKRILGYLVFFVIILGGIAAVTYKYLVPRPLSCEQSQYADQTAMRCLSCDSSCSRCTGGQKDMCTSCRGNMYLIMKKLTDKTGVCSDECKGMIVKSKSCLVEH